MRQGLVRDAATAKVAAEINELLRGVDMALCDHIGHAEQGLYGHWGDGLAWDLSSLRARLEKVRELVNGASEAPCCPRGKGVNFAPEGSAQFF